MMTETQVEIKMDKACSNLLVNQTLEKVLYGNLNAIERPVYTQEDYDYGAAIHKLSPKSRTIIGCHYENRDGFAKGSSGADFFKG